MRMGYTFGVTPQQLRDGRVMYCVKQYLRHALERAGAINPVRIQRHHHSGVYILVFSWEVRSDGLET